MHRGGAAGVLLVGGALTILHVASTAIRGWHVYFDDAFISYRYALHLAEGHGLVWNVGSAPTEGFTNLLLILILAPLMATGLDPLLVTRVLSFACLLGLAVLLWSEARTRYACPPHVALVPAFVVLLAPASASLVMVGLETVLYATALFVAFLAATALVTAPGVGTSLRLVLAVTLAVLLRPEAALLYPVAIAVLLWTWRARLSTIWRPLTVGIGAATAVATAYLVWKAAYFGHLLPNPFYLKADGPGLSRDGIESVAGFVFTYPLAVGLAAWTVVVHLSRRATPPAAPTVASTHVLLGTGLGLVTAVFFMRTDTLMDIQGRFLYPLLPIMLCLSVPTLRDGLGALASAGVRPLAVTTLTLGTIVVVAGVTPVQLRQLASPGTYLDARRWIDAPLQATTLMQREHQAATALAAYPQVSALRIAFADSGVIPYYSRALWLDLVGLTDPAIARASHRDAAVDHVFDWQPDVAIIPATGARHWLRTGHGVLGNYEAWMRDARWDAYEYAGTIQTSSSYDLQVLIRAASAHRPSLDRFLLEHVLDGVYPALPLPLGTRGAGTPVPTCRDLPPPTVCSALPPRAGAPNLP